MDVNRRPSVLKHYEVKNMHKKEPVLSLIAEVDLSSGNITNGYSSKPADNDGSGSESGYTTPKKRRARRSSTKGTENMSQEKDNVAKPYSKQDTETLIPEMSGKGLHSRLNCTKTEVHTVVRRTGVRDTSPVAEIQPRISESKTSLSVVGKKIDDRISKTKLGSSMSSKEDSWTLFKPPPVFPVDNSSAKIVPKISYASKVKENLNKPIAASTEMTQMPGKPSHVPMSALKTVVSGSFTNLSASLDANGCYFVETSFDSAADLSVAPSDPDNQEEKEVQSSSDNGCSSLSCLSAPEPRKTFVYSHKPLNMQPHSQSNQKALGDIFQNQWGLSFINEPNAGPEGAPVSCLVVPFEISDITFQGGNVPFLIQPSLTAVSLPAPQGVQRRSNGTVVAAIQDCPQAQSVHQEERKEERRSSNPSYEDLDAQSTRNSLLNSVKMHTVKEQDGAHVWGWADLQAAVLYHTKEFEYLLTLHKQDPKRVMYYEEVMDGPEH
ncbi:nuclear fragile X mental retardation-interacting protein 2-like [Tachysurus ichikawai]